MKKFNKRPSKAAVNKAIEFYRTEAKNTDEQLLRQSSISYVWINENSS